MRLLEVNITCTSNDRYTKNLIKPKKLEDKVKHKKSTQIERRQAKPDVNNNLANHIIMRQNKYNTYIKHTN